jgi:hypothetical protein
MPLHPRAAQVDEGVPDPSPMTHIREESTTPPPLQFDNVQVREESMSPPPLSFNDPENNAFPPHSDSDMPTVPSKRRHEDDETESEGHRVSPTPPTPSAEAEVNDDEPWEEDVHETMAGASPKEIRGWDKLRDQIKKDLTRNHASLPLSHINQLMILRNFATLRLKGHSRISASNQIAQQWHEKMDGSSIHFARRVRSLARHYQIFEQLPVERRGGGKNAQSLLRDEAVKKAALSWLTEQAVGSLTPSKFMEALNGVILPSLGITTKRLLCERTARRWLIKLGWVRSRVKKGVYMDGHERPDVVKYREEIFLPAMKKFEWQMIRFEGPELTRVEPVLEPGERILIPEFHDESCFQQNDHQSSLW